jgi:hypothetical protein
MVFDWIYILYELDKHLGMTNVNIFLLDESTWW